MIGEKLGGVGAAFGSPLRFGQASCPFPAARWALAAREVADSRRNLIRHPEDAIGCGSLLNILAWKHMPRGEFVMEPSVRRSLAIALLLGALVATAKAVSPAPQVDPVGEALAWAKERALNAGLVDWEDAERAARFAESEEAGELGRTKAIRVILARLRDGHSFYQAPRGQTRAPSPAEAMPPRPPGRQMKPIAVAHTDGSYGRVEIAGWTGEPSQVPAATELVRVELNRAASVSTCGLIVDLRSNSGGNMWPMMGGLAPLYSDAVLLTFTQANGSSKQVEVRNSILMTGGEPYPPPAGISPFSNTRPRHIAVLIGPRTSSSGEITALGFQGQANVRSFGSATDGRTTANSSRRLANGGLLVLTTSRIVDRNGTSQEGPIQPDVVSSDPLRDASVWLDAVCRGGPAS